MALGIGQNRPVGVFLDKSIESVHADLGILYAGDFYMNLDIKTPAERIRNILQLVEPAAIISTTRQIKPIEGIIPSTMKVILLDEADEAAEVDVSTAIGHAACQAANDIGAKALIAVTYSGYTARMMSRFYPKQPIIAATPQPRTARQMGIIRGVIPVMTQTETEFDQLTSAAIDKARENGLVDYGDRVVISAGLPLNSPGTTNLIKVETV
jgi:pyruvate kinase